MLWHPLPGLPGVSVALGLAVGFLALWWLARVGREARAGYVPGWAWWAVPGLVLLPLAAELDVPALFGLGAALLLLAEFWLFAYVRPPQRPSPAWPALGVLVGGALVWRTVNAGAPVLLALGAGLLLAGAAGLVSAALWPAPRPAVPSPGLALRFARARVPERPELNVQLAPAGAYVRNVSPHKLALAGWSPAGVNAWLPVRGPDGRPKAVLASGEVALLPVTAWDSGVRVWYGPAATPSEAHLFRADWTPAARAADRVLN